MHSYSWYSPWVSSAASNEIPGLFLVTSVTYFVFKKTEKHNKLSSLISPFKKIYKARTENPSSQNNHCYNFSEYRALFLTCAYVCVYAKDFYLQEWNDIEQICLLLTFFT